MHVFYLHGFASSPASTKAAKFAERLRARGLTVHCPDLNEPDFSTLTVTRMLEQVDRVIEALPPAPLVLVGSSLGAFVAVLVADRHRSDARWPVARIVLLAPALDFGANRMRELGRDGIARWRETDRLDVFHYAYERTVPLGYALYEDAGRYDALSVPIDVPVLAFQGTRDTVVDPAVVERWARGRANVTLRLVDDDHQLGASLPRILDETDRFLDCGQ